MIYTQPLLNERAQVLRRSWHRCESRGGAEERASQRERGERQDGQGLHQVIMIMIMMMVMMVVAMVTIRRQDGQAPHQVGQSR